MSQSPSSPRPWWRQPPLWVGAGPLLVFLVVSAIDLALAKKFTDQGQTLISTLLGGLWQWMVLLLFLSVRRRWRNVSMLIRARVF